MPRYIYYNVSKWSMTCKYYYVSRRSWYACPYCSVVPANKFMHHHEEFIRKLLKLYINEDGDTMVSQQTLNVYLSHCWCWVTFTVNHHSTVQYLSSQPCLYRYTYHQQQYLYCNKHSYTRYAFKSLGLVFNILLRHK